MEMEVPVVIWSCFFDFIGLEILAFPSNQFNGQEPGSNEEIQEFVCTRFKAEYPVFGKVGIVGIVSYNLEVAFDPFTCGLVDCGLSQINQNV